MDSEIVICKRPVKRAGMWCEPDCAVYVNGADEGRREFVVSPDVFRVKE